MNDFGAFEISEGVGEYFLNKLQESEDGGTFWNDEKLRYGLFHKGLPCGVVITSGKEDDEPKKPAACFCLPSSFFTFLIVFSISGLKSIGVPVRKDLGIPTINDIVSPTTVQIC